MASTDEPSDPRRRAERAFRRRRIGRVALQLASNGLVLVVIAAALELAASFYIQLPGQGLVESPHLHHVWKPNSVSEHRNLGRRNAEFRDPYVKVHNGSSWLESYEVAREKPPGTIRIFYVGDSFTAGYSAMNDSMPDLVEQRLQQLVSGTPYRIEVINTGTPSYSPLIYNVLIRRELVAYEPDLIVVNVDMTDDFDDWVYAHSATYDPSGAPEAVLPTQRYAQPFFDSDRGVVPATLSTRLHLFLYLNSHAYGYVLDRFRPAAPAARNAEERGLSGFYQRWSWCRSEWDPQTETNAARTLALIRRIAALSREHDFELVLTTVPHHLQYARSADGGSPPLWSNRPHLEVAQLARKERIRFLDSYRALAPNIEGTPQHEYYYRDDIHFNPRGNRLWAEIHVAFLTKLLPQVRNFYLRESVK